MNTSRSKRTILGPALPNIPWEERPPSCEGRVARVVWRCARNPIIPRDLIPSSNSIFNSAVVPFQGEFAGVFPCAALADAETGRIAIYYGGADTVTCLAFAQVDELIDFIKQNSL
jgi:predicted GH43/DUF377 family glycosyl hydrolase